MINRLGLLIPGIIHARSKRFEPLERFEPNSAAA
jgi:hypothetical protein